MPLATATWFAPAKQWKAINKNKISFRDILVRVSLGAKPSLFSFLTLTDFEICQGFLFAAKILKFLIISITLDENVK